ncbi:MAG: DegT/DnrJ/EryC1/StrS aminotransferase family protein [Desulfobacteraceae bacterium]|nr:MAG: DegT/DnrJ/EryC1/StrS aminotransferase family protein [Desulfobacteraceae bacterium]
MNFAPWPYFEDDEVQSVIDVLKSGDVNQWTGNEIAEFENEFARYIGVTHAIALANGSLALDIALKVFDIGQGDEVIVTPRSFVASASCISLQGAVPVFVDVDPVSQNITLENVSRAVSEKTRAVIAVNLSGWPCELDRLQSFCKENGLVLIEDCAQSHGASFKDKKTGAFGDCAIFSFCQDKIMTTGGEGGMLLTNDNSIWEKAWSYKDHGKNPGKSFVNNPEFGFRWLVDSFGTNCRMTEMQAAIGRVQLRKLDQWVDKRREYAGFLNDNLKNVPGLRLTVPEKEVYHAYYKYYAFVEPGALKQGWNRDSILKNLEDKGIPCNTGICPEIYLEDAFRTSPFKINNDLIDLKQGGRVTSRLPNASELGENSMMFVVHPTLEPASIQFTIDQIRSAMESAVK